MKKLLFTRHSPEIAVLRDLIERQKHRTIVAWVIDCSEPVLAMFESRHPGDLRPRNAVTAAAAWAAGQIKMPVARRAALDAHRAATEVEDDPVACAAARAIGHVVGTVHVETHALGFVIYGLTALARDSHSDDRKARIMAECLRLYDRLRYWERQIDDDNRAWADFLMRENLPNKEKRLHEKENANEKKKQIV